MISVEPGDRACDQAALCSARCWSMLAACDDHWFASLHGCDGRESSYLLAQLRELPFEFRDAFALLRDDASPVHSRRSSHWRASPRTCRGPAACAPCASRDAPARPTRHRRAGERRQDRAAVDDRDRARRQVGLGLHDLQRLEVRRPCAIVARQRRERARHRQASRRARRPASRASAARRARRESGALRARRPSVPQSGRSAVASATNSSRSGRAAA